MRLRKVLPVAFIYLCTLILPFIAALILAGKDYVFGGFLLNPLDGNSYLAKMMLGWQGEWIFRLPYTANPGSGAYLFLFYILLGHISRLLAINLLVMFHITRLISAGLMFYAIIRFIQRFFPESHWLAPSLWLLIFGSGLGWLTALFGGFTADFWVAEAFPFLSAFSNPHFPLGIAILLTILMEFQQTLSWGRILALGLLSFLLSIILPFAVVIAIVIMGITTLWEWAETRHLKWQALICVGVPGGICLIYQFTATLADPVLALWNQQNLTISPPLWNLLISFSPAIIFAGWGIYKLLPQITHPGRRLLISWFGSGLILTYIPFSLQRRFMTGLFIPVAILAILGISQISSRKWSRNLFLLLIMLSLPTNLLILLGGLGADLQHNSALFNSRSENQALTWIDQNTQKGDLILASPEFGTWIPAQTGRRVIYGHPYETVSAEKEKQILVDFYSGQNPGEMDTLIEKLGVREIIWGPRENKYGTIREINGYSHVAQFGDVAILEIKAQP